jgi:hypothetical protein
MKLTRAVTSIRLCDANHTKITAFDAVAAEYMALCQRSVTHFCIEAESDGSADPCLPRPLSQRWQRVAKAWRANDERRRVTFAASLAAWLEQEHAPEETPPEWIPWQTSTLQQMVIQANAHVALLHARQHTSFAYWLRISPCQCASRSSSPRAWPRIVSAVWRASGGRAA